MLCSASELGMPDEVDGLLILPADLEPGTPINEVFPAGLRVEDHAEPSGLPQPPRRRPRTLRPDQAAAEGEVVLPGRGCADPRCDRCRGRDPIDLARCPLYTARKISRRQSRRKPGLAEAETHRGRPAPDQQHRRHHQLRPDGDGAAAARLRPGEARRRDRRTHRHAR